LTYFQLISNVQVFISFFFKPQTRKKHVKVSAGTKCKRESSSKAKEVIEEPAMDLVEPVHDNDMAMIEDALEPPAPDDGQGVHDEQVVNNLRTRAIRAMADKDTVSVYQKRKIRWLWDCFLRQAYQVFFLALESHGH
jgi:hypothetical protein